MNGSLGLLGIAGMLAAVPLLAMLGISYKTKVPRFTIDQNHTIPIRKALTIEAARREGKPAIFHGGCNGCIWRHQNTTTPGSPSVVGVATLPSIKVCLINQ